MALSAAWQARKAASGESSGREARTCSAACAAAALAIEKTPKWVTLTLKDPNASQDEMNQELADAGIDRVRVMTVPGPPKAVGTWPGYLEFGPHCEGGVTKFGYDALMRVMAEHMKNTLGQYEGSFLNRIPACR